MPEPIGIILLSAGLIGVWAVYRKRLRNYASAA
ncbi:PEP-CTERM sorting domain-containing protein [Telmatocola sphagniphila]|uniref:PEP-CTERM sorting domain-containing protein n=1 Tax=Telmatocola sphagniphila TaxID=1123043 RepID=A0A8E6B9S1_9BACT|nr:PEP-CTERM sorting domain-containing protein [Telmatocola sphagniphila]